MDKVIKDSQQTRQILQQSQNIKMKMKQEPLTYIKTLKKHYIKTTTKPATYKKCTCFMSYSHNRPKKIAEQRNEKQEHFKNSSTTQEQEAQKLLCTRKVRKMVSPGVKGSPPADLKIVDLNGKELKRRKLYNLDTDLKK